MSRTLSVVRSSLRGSMSCGASLSAGLSAFASRAPCGAVDAPAVAGRPGIAFCAVAAPRASAVGMANIECAAVAAARKLLDAGTACWAAVAEDAGACGFAAGWLSGSCWEAVTAAGAELVS